ncbi:MAG: TonB-dependent receptor [Saprospiraceae bacterium]
MKYCYLIAVAILCNLTLGAQSVSGRVSDENGEALVGLSVFEKGTNNGIFTNSEGFYRLSLTRSEAVLVFAMTGFETQEIRVEGRSTLDVSMKPSSSLLDQIVVVGSRAANRTRTETPVPVDVIGMRQTTLNTARFDVTSILNYTAPSFNFTRQSGSDGADHIDLATLRGLGPDQTLVLVNGKRRHQTAFVGVFGTRGRGNSGTDLSAIPAAAIDRVEILRDGASAQYGSDAIAGVVNIILRKETGRLSADLGYSVYHDPKYNPAFKPEIGQYIHGNKLDGATYNASVNYGVGIGERGGFLNVGLQYANQDKTFRQELDGVLPVNIYRRAHGDGSMQSLGGMFNLEAPLNDRGLVVYAFGGYNGKNSDAYAFTRNFSARPDRFPTDANGALIPVPGIIMESSDGEFFFNPRIRTEIDDISASAGVRGRFGQGWTWDLSNTLGRNNFHFFGEGTFNAGLGAQQTSFDDGGFSFMQNTANLNLNKELPALLSGANLALGVEHRLERYQLFAGELASYANFDSTKASGAQGFPGYQPADEADARRSCVGVYADFEADLNEKWMAAAAVRFEHYSDFGATTNFKLASRYKLSPAFNLRASASTGFRAPSLQQINFSSTFTTVQGGQIAEVKIAPNDNPITRAAGIPGLKQERSVNASLGFAWRPLRDLSVTLDAYQVRIRDRVVLSGQFDAEDATLNPALTNELQRLRVSLAQFFANAVNTTNSGIDLVFDYNRRRSNGHIRALLAANVQRMTIDRINAPAALDDTPEHRATFLSDREQKFILASAPPVKVAGTFEYGLKKLTLGARLTYFGRIELLGYGEDGLGINPMVPTDADENVFVPDRYDYAPRLVSDLYASWRFNSKIILNLGADNLFNVHPALGYVPIASGWAFNNETGGPWDAVQMGGNGRRYFLRLGLNF